MTKKIFKSILIVAGTVLLASFIIILGCLYNYFGSIQKTQMKDTLTLASIAVEEEGADYLKQIVSDRYRLTWINSDGTVIYDTKNDAESLENHADRTEVRDAIENGEGISTRYSSTLLEKTMYYAKRLADGTVLRISISRATVGVLLLGMIQPIMVILATALILSYLLANQLSKRIVNPLNNLDLDHPLENDAYEELSPLLNRISRQHKQISSQMRELQRKTDEFTQITGSMKEGLVLLDIKECVLSINPAAKRIFSADDSCIGKDFLTIDRSSNITETIHHAMAQGHSEMRLSRAGLVWQFDISRIDSEGEPIGAVLLAFDITDQENAEQSRREFTANVSHELKTPLQGIIGSAELIENGMVKHEDMPRFIGHIRSEAQRLVSLIDDIIRLSQLDEGEELPFETVDLMEISQEVTEDLHDAAKKKNIALSVTGCHASVNGVRRMIYEILYNLCDNAIKYNTESGSVQLSIKKEETTASITVSDTGIGIPPEHQSRIFERFYRVDKSHSKASGGTGLGLSIVKHAVQYHGGKIDLQSEPGKGTSICITLPL